MIAWKVCLIDKNDNNVSINNLKTGKVIYKIGKTSKRSHACGPLAVFSNLRNAKRFMSSLNLFESYSILRCDIIKSKESTLWTSSGRKRDRCFPDGTVFAETVTPLKRVY